MAERKFTLFELHFDGGVQIGPRTIGGREEAREELEGRVEDADVSVEDESGGRRIRLGPPLAALALVVGLGLGARRIASRRDAAQTTFDDEEFVDDAGDDIDIEA